MKYIKKVLIDLAKKNEKTRMLLRYVQGLSKKAHCYHYKRKYATDSKVIVFSSFMGRKYACSPRAIFLQMKEMPEFNDYEFIWAFKNKKKKIAGAKTVRYGSRKHYRACARAKYIIDNSRLLDCIQLKSDQEFIQCWHGTPLKRLGYDIPYEGGNAMNSLKDLRKKYRRDAERYTYLLSPSKFTTDRLSSAFALETNNPEVKIIEEGYPRNDLLSNYTESDLERIRTKLGLDSTKKVALYAPTWRDNQHQSGVGYTYELGVDFDVLQKELGDEWVILFRPHYFIANKFDFEKYEGFVIDVSKINEISELYIVSDVLITDYSSVFFDYAVLRKPIIFYMYDLEEYRGEIRDFYIELDDLPGDIVENEKDLIKSINMEFSIGDKYQSFVDKFNYMEDGNASKRVIDIIFKDL